MLRFLNAVFNRNKEPMRCFHSVDTKLNTSECPSPAYAAWQASLGIQFGNVNMK